MKNRLFYPSILAAVALALTASTQAWGAGNATVYNEANPATTAPDDPNPHDYDSADVENPLDWEWQKSNALEDVLNQKLQRIIEGQGIADPHFRSSVTVLFEKQKPAAEHIDPKAVTSPKKPTLDFPELRGNPMDLDSLIAKFQTDNLTDRALASFPNAALAKFSEAPKQTYGVSLVSMGVTLDPSVAPDRVKALKDYLEAAFKPAFDSRLMVQVQQAPLIDPPGPGFFDRLEKFQKLALALLGILAAVTLVLLMKLIPTRRTAHKFSFQHDKTNEEKQPEPLPETDEAKDEVPEIPVDAPIEPPPAPPTPDYDAQVAILESQICDIVGQTPALSRLMIQDFLRSDLEAQGSEDSMVRIALLLETLAKFKIQAEKLSVKGDVLRRFQGIRARLSGLASYERASLLGEVYWSLVAFSFLTEGDQAFPPFQYLEMLEESKIAALIASEKPEYQAAVLLGMSEKKSARVLQRFAPNVRQALFELICAGKTPDPGSLKALAERVREKSVSLFAAQNLPTSTEEGVSAIAMLLGRLDFKAQLESIRSLLSRSPDILRSLKRQVFFVALLPEARTEFLSQIFADRPIEWTTAILSVFDAGFKARVLEGLPPMQRRMFESGRPPEVSSAAAARIMDELQTDIRGKIERNELSLDEVFGLTDDVPAQAPSGPVQAQAA